jgi:hypothetical protein
MPRSKLLVLVNKEKVSRLLRKQFAPWRKEVQLLQKKLQQQVVRSKPRTDSAKSNG